MFDSDFTIREDFPPADFEQWRALAEAGLRDTSADKVLSAYREEDLDLQIVYGRGKQSPFVDRESNPKDAVGWDLRQQHNTPCPKRCNEAILEDVRGGVTSLLLQINYEGKSGAGLKVHGIADLDLALAEVDLAEVGVYLHAGADVYFTAELLAELWQRRGVNLQNVTGAFNTDPISLFARGRDLPGDLETALTRTAELAIRSSQDFLRVSAVCVDTSVYHHAGATDAEDLALAMATGVQYLRSLTDGGMSIDAAATQIQFSMRLGTQPFLSIAKLRAGRHLWARVIEASGGKVESSAMRVHAQISDRVLTCCDSHVNLMRNTVAVFAAGLGGAEAVTSVPFDTISGGSDNFSRRVARNTALLLQEEAQLHRVVDPAGGSWLLEEMTGQLAEKSWSLFQKIERQGGIVPVLKSGWVATRMRASHAKRARSVASRKRSITGISVFPDLEEQVSCEFSSELVNDEALPLRRLAEPYEKLRAAVDRQEQRPQVFLANMGPVAQHAVRANFATGFFEVGGFEVLTNEGFANAESAVQAFCDSGAAIAVICSSDKYYADHLSEVVAQLKSAGARTIVLAGNPGASEAAWRDVGVDRFIFVSCNILEVLTELLVEEGVLSQ